MYESKNVQIAVAFLKYTGVKVIEKSMKQCLDNGGSFEIIAGLDFKTTDSQALQYFINLKKEYSKANFYCFSHNSDPTSTIEHKDKSESKDAIKILLNIVKESDPKHFEILEKNLVS
jgi:HKD family nuclease